VAESAAPGEASQDDARRWRRQFAAEANNRAWTLAERPSRNAAEDAEMLDAAHATRHLWAPIGTPENAALADLLLGQVHALLGHGADALAHARAAHAFLAPAERPGWQVAFAHAVLAHAAHVAGDAQLHARAHAHAVAAAALLDAQDRRIFDASFGTVPTPPR
jgi:hypothetical protein